MGMWGHDPVEDYTPAQWREHERRQLALRARRKLTRLELELKFIEDMERWGRDDILDMIADDTCDMEPAIQWWCKKRGYEYRLDDDD